VQDYADYLAQWDSRLANGVFQDEPNEIAPTYINRAPVAWVGTHRHNGKGENEAYRFTYLYHVRLDVPKGASAVTLPDNSRIKIVAATLVKSKCDDVRAAQPLYDIANATVTSIAADHTAFMDRAVATISCPAPGAEIHYTLDGHEPTMDSPRYEKPVTITESTVLKSRALLAGADDHFVSALKFNRLIPKSPVVIAKPGCGIQCSYFEGEWKKLPNFDSLKATKEFLAGAIEIPNVARKEDYGLVFAGYVQIPQEGMYDFAISSDDGSTLMVADSLLIDNDGLHGSGEVPGSIALKAGLHPIKVQMFQCKGGQDLQLFISGPGMEKQQLPSSMLWHKIKRGRR
jgi:hypothetical protein